MQTPYVDVTCQFCGDKCFIPVSTLWWQNKAPMEMVKAYFSRGVDCAATCQEGAKMEQALLGYCYAD